MCGIAGFVNRDPEHPADEALLRRMTRTLLHRGPDEEGYFTDGPVGLGMRRLRVIDLAGGKQPITNEDGTVWVVFNGEIYNFPDLRRELAGRGHRFTTNSDTEVIVHLYEEQGTECVQALHGMFAFAIWDKKTRTLCLARDRFGKKPLYYAETPSGFWFGSELKALLPVAHLSTELNLTALDDYLALGYIPAPHSIFRAVQKLPSASVLTLRRNQTHIRRYWRLAWRPGAPLPQHQALDGLRAHLENAVRCRLTADVPFGAFLSGGIDSTAVVWLMSQALATPVKTFSIGFDQQGTDELPFAREVAHAFHTEHYEEVVAVDALSLLPRLVDAFDEPFGDSSAIPTYLVSRLARQYVTMVLSGDGGDELFAGYERYQRYLLLSRLRWLLLGTVGTGALAATLRALGAASAPLSRAAAALQRAALPPLARYAQLVGLYAPDLRRELLKTGDSLSPTVPLTVASAWQEALSFDPIRRLQAVDTDTYLVDDVLAKVDRTSMANSLEARSPLLDHQLWEYVAALPTTYKLRWGKTKYLLRALLHGQVPPSVLSRPKQGFGIPRARWFRGDWQDAVRPLLLENNMGQYFARPCLERMLDEHASGRIDHGERLWLLLVFAVWRQSFLQEHAAIAFPPTSPQGEAAPRTARLNGDATIHVTP